MTDAPPVTPHATMQSRVLDLVRKGGSYRCETQNEQNAALKLNAKGLIRRDRKDGKLWYDAAAATAPDGEGGEGGPDAPETGVDRLPAPVDDGSSSELVVAIETARALLDAGDVQSALLLSTGLYERAKAGAAYAKKVKASRELIDKARRMQGEALKIESMCYVAMADAIDEAQSKGHVARQGRPEKVRDADVFTLQDVGVDKRRLSEARKLRNAERDRPGIVERAIQARIEAGLEPSRANLRAAVGTSSAPKEDRGDNLYQTPPEAMHTLLALETFSSKVREPAVGRGAISSFLEAAGYTVIIADLIDYGTADRFGEVQQVADFLTSEADGEDADIVTNPPYGALLNRFVAHALKVHRPRKMALLLNLNFLCGFDDDDRNFAMDENPPARVLVFKRRLPMMHRDGWDGPEATSRMNTAWFVWEMNEAGTYVGPTEIRRVDWMDYMPAAVQAEAAE